MASTIYLNPNQNFDLSYGNVSINGNSNNEIVNFADNISAVTIDNKVDAISLPYSVEEYQYQSVSGQLFIYRNSVLIAKVAIQTDLDGTNIGFNNGYGTYASSNNLSGPYTAKAVLSGSDIKIGNGVVSSVTPANLNYSSSNSYSLTSNFTSVNEGSSAIFTLTTTNVPSGTSIAYTLSGINASDVVNGLLAGNVVVGLNGQAIITVPIVADNLTEGPETLTIKAGGVSAFAVINDTSISTITPTPTAIPTYALSASSSSVNEGSIATFILSTANVAFGTSVFYSLSGISAADITGGAINGTVIVGANGIATISIPTLTHLTFQGNKTLTVTASGASATTTLIDNAPAGSPDLYDGKYLSISKVVSGSTTYSNIIVTVQQYQIVSIGVGDPINNYDTYDGISQLLTVPNVKVGTSTYTNVVLKVSPNDIVSINGLLTKPPTVSVPDISLSSISPASKSVDVKSMTDIKLTFSEYITPVAGNITLIEPNGKQDLFDVTANPFVQIAGNQLTLLHSDFFLVSGTYQLLIPSGVIHGVSGGNYSGLNGYSINVVGLATLSGSDGGGGGGGGGF